MPQLDTSIPKRSLAWIGALAVAVDGLRSLVVASPWAMPGSTLVGLILGAVACALLQRTAKGRHHPQMHWTFVMAALALLPPPGALLAALAASLIGPGMTGRVRAFAASGLAVIGSHLLLGSLRPAESWGGPAALFWFVALFVSLRLLSSAAAAVLRLSLPAVPSKAWWLRAGVESIGVLLTWALCSLAQQREWLAAAGVGLLTLLVQLVLVRLGIATGAARRAQAALAARVVELDTLHAISREIIASFDAGRVCMILERGCRKIFNIDFLAIVLLDPADSSSGTLYAHRRGAGPKQRPLDGEDALVRWVADHKRGLYVEDLAQGCRERIRPSSLIDSATRSLLVAPLIVEDRTIGLLSVQHHSAGAFDEHRLSVLRTMAQQTAVAVENARHYAMATVDSLTGFFLRDYFFRRLDEEYNRVSRYGGTFSLLMVDLDGFKEVNDRHGHLSGDRYLRAVSATIQEQLRAADMPCRYGGDEFCLLLPETDLAGARTIAERIRAAVSTTVMAAGRATIRATTSVGLASFPEHDGGSVRALMQNADEALYRAKRAGRDCVMPFAA